MIPLLGRARLWLATGLLLVSAHDARGQVRVAAASDLQAALPGVIARFEKETGISVRATFGSSGNFFAQIQNGAPFDVFLSADIDFPRRLQAAGLGKDVTLYATGRLVLWTRHDSGIDVRAGLASLANPRIRRIAMANPQHAPYGRAAAAALRRQGIYDAVASRLVLGENIAQTAQFVQSGNADVGLVALSLTSAPAMKAAGTFVEIPASLHPPIEQGAIVLAGARDAAAARRFVQFLVSAETRRYLADAGFDAP